MICPRCKATLTVAFEGRCGFCNRRLPDDVLMQVKLAALVANPPRWHARERRRIRTAAAADGEPAQWLHDQPGHPLGIGMPPGHTLREDGESHAQAWRRVLRADPCSYCGGPGGTVDHVVPQATGQRYVQRWTNLVGACNGCNESKSDKPLLRFLVTRPLDRAHEHHPQDELEDEHDDEGTVKAAVAHCGSPTVGVASGVSAGERAA